MRLIKLLAYALFGYALYEFFRGMSQDQGGGGEFGGAGRQRAFGSESSVAGEGGSNISGRGEGQTVSTLESDGGSVNRTVGRGVMTP